MSDIICYSSFDEISLKSYESLWTDCGSPAFYHPDLIRAAQKHPLLPIGEAYYLAVWQGEALLAFAVAYHQTQPDPFGTLARSTGVVFAPPHGGILGHVAHCYDTRVLHRDGDSEAAQAVLRKLIEVMQKKQVPGGGLVNIAEGPSLDAARQAGLLCNFMHDRFCVDASGMKTFADYLQALPRHGRQEMNRQWRKFEDEGGTVRVLNGDEADLRSVVALCNQTSAKNGTPHYYPLEAFFHFLQACSALLSVVQIEQKGRLVGAVVCLNEPGCLHMWAGGADYSVTEYSPYTIMIGASIRHGIAQGLRRLEAGRTNAKIKARLGCSPVPLYSALWVNREA
ncbi:GNAT family N-acetyltransferase [Roseateles sp. DB2]|uniref:GNAT family N-acetyltransferase n=1 Tax=Roseateles sp. DB2 TaxID=3453717 RepID=UPI003EE9AFAC